MDIERLRTLLTPQQLAFCTLFLERYADITAKRYSASQAWLDVNPDKDQEKDRHLARTRAAEYLRAETRSRQYIDAVLQQKGIHQPPSLRTIEQTMADIEAMATADINQLVTWKVVEDADGNKHPMPQIMDPNEVPPEVRRLVRSITWTKNGPKLELHDQLRAQDMLNKMRGSYAAEKLEVSGPGGGAIKVEVSGEIKLTIKKLLDDM